MDKITEKEIRQPDAFIQTIDRVNAKFQPNKKAVLGLIALVVLGAAGWATSDYYNTRREAQAQAALFVASHQVEKKEQELAAANDAKATPDKANKSAKGAAKAPAAGTTSETLETKPKNLDSDYGTAIKSLQSVTDTYPGTRASWVAALEIARLDQEYGQVEQGYQALQKVEVGSKSDDLLSATVQLRLGDLLQIKGQCEQAISKWNLISGTKGFSPLKPEAMLRTGLCYENLKKFDEAKTTYEKLSTDKDLAESRAGREGKKFLKLLQSARRSS